MSLCLCSMGLIIIITISSDLIARTINAVNTEMPDLISDMSEWIHTRHHMHIQQQQEMPQEMQPWQQPDAQRLLKCADRGCSRFSPQGRADSLRCEKQLATAKAAVNAVKSEAHTQPCMPAPRKRDQSQRTRGCSQYESQGIADATQFEELVFHPKQDRSKRIRIRESHQSRQRGLPPTMDPPNVDMPSDLYGVSPSGPDAAMYEIANEASYAVKSETHT